MARKQSEIASATRRATWLVYSNRALRNVIFMPAYDAVDHWLRRRLVAYLYRTLIPVRQSEFMLQLKIKKAATDRSQHAWSGSSPRRYAWTLCTATCLFTLAKPGLQQHRPRHGTRPLNLGDSLDRRSDDAVVGVLRPLGNGRTRTVRCIGADSGPVDPGAAGPAGAAEDHASVRVEPARRRGTALPRWFGIAVAVWALIGSTVRRWFRGVRDPHTQWLYRRAWTAPAARPCNAQPCPSLCRPRSADTRPGIVTTPSTQSLR